MSDGASVLVDTGPLVALFDPSDAAHDSCKEELARLGRRDLVSSLAVVTEATYLLAFSVEAQASLLTFVSTGAIRILDLTMKEISQAAVLMKRFADLPMDFADATLIVLAERLNTSWVFTLDRRDFSLYRVGRREFRILPSPERGHRR